MLIFEIILVRLRYCSRAITRADTSPCGCAGRPVRVHQAELRPRQVPRSLPATREPDGEPTASAEADVSCASLIRRGHGTCTGGARIAAALTADTAFSHVLGEGIAPAPLRPWSDHCGPHAIFSGCLRSTLSAADEDVGRAAVCRKQGTVLVWPVAVSWATLYRIVEHSP
jgi:hypothetical protein